MKKNFKFLFCLMLAIVASITSVKADTYYRIKMIPVLENGASGLVFAYTEDQWGTYQYPGNITKDNKWKTSIDTVLHCLDDNEVNFHLCAKVGNIQSNVVGWYWNEECTQPISYLQAYTDNHIYEGIYSSLGRNIEYSDSEATAPTTTVYVKFTKLPTPEFDWSSYGTTTLETGKKYYIFSPAMYRFLKATSTSTTSAGDATLFTYIYVSSANEKVTIEGSSQTVPYNNVKFSYLEGGATKYVRHNSSWSTSSYTLRHYPQADGTYRMTEAYSYGGANNIQVNLDGTISYPLTNSISRGPGSYWIYIPESTVLAQAHVNSLNENGSVTITSSPTGQGTAYVKFNVSASSVPAGFNYSFTNEGDGHFVIDEANATCSNGILSVPVKYTAQNRHFVDTPASTATIKITSKNDATNYAEGTATAYVDFEPRFALAVDELDWSRVGAEVVETFYLGQEIAASQRDRLANKLVKNDSQTTGVAANHATWTATIIGTNANQFKFANGTQAVSGAYSANLLDVHYAPTTTGNHEATLHIVTSYTDAASHTETYEKNITLRGVGSAASRITFAANGSETPLTAESYNYGDIIGTNHKDVTAELFISQITNPSAVWYDPDTVFEFDSAALKSNLTQKYQTLSFRAHPKKPVIANTNYTATLTVSGKGTANEDVSATITLTYTALPLIQTTVTWNWGTIKENSTVNTPITTNSDGAWTLEKSVGDKITYDGSAKTTTVPYLHHEPGVSAEFVLNIPQTDTYSALDSAFEAIVVPILPKHVYITRQADLGDHNSGTDGEYGKVKHWSSSYETWHDDTKTLEVKGDDIWFYVNGRTKFEFDFTGNVGWSIKELDKNGGTISSLLGQSFATGHNVLSVSPQTATLLLHGNGFLSNIHFYEYDTIAADFNNIALVDNGSTISNKVVTATFANKRQVTAYLNATAAQYFQMSATGKATGSSMVFDSNDGLGLGLAQDKVFTVALKAGANADEARAATAGNACQLIFADDYTYNHEVLSLPIVIIEPCEITYKHSANGSYTVTYQSDEVAHLVDNTDYTPSITTAEPADYVVALSAPTPASGYQFQGWKVNDVIVSCLETFTTSIGIDGSVVEAVFVPAEPQNYRVGDVYFANLEAALSAANSSSDSKVVTPTQDITLGDGTTSVNYTIPVGVTLLIPHKADFFELQETPDLVNVNSDALELAQKLSAYRTLTLKEGVTITCNGTICVAGNMVTANGGRKSAYPTGEVGMINMVHGGHIELNNGANLYCWGYIKGQDMDQGNNTVGTGTVTANSGSIVWENFELGDWRGGSASLDIYNNTEGRKLFPFQSYAIQNIEIPTTFKFGSFLKNYTSITTGYGNHGAVFSMIGPAETMFLLTDEDSKVRTWYDATTDLTCYELSGTAQLDALHITVYVPMSSENYNLPISNSMHIILDSCDMTLAKPMMVQAGAIIEIKPDAIVNLTNNLYLYDVDQWNKYAHNYYFRSFNNITSHKDRGAENSKAGLDDAKLIVDGTFNIENGGKIYATAGGANVMGNDGGIITFNATLPDSAWLWAVEVKSGIPYIEWVRNRVYAANLCNEDGTYTRSIGSKSFINVNGRWFVESAADEKANHTYDFTYMSDGNTGDDITTSAVYSHDKTGLEARMKWFNVVEDANCAGWWLGSNPAAHYNYTMLNDWHQFMTTETENVYSGSDNKLYQKNECTWIEEGAVDENCLYTIGGVKKALVNGEFIPLTPNGYDAAYHNGDKYYICFEGCNWHEAAKVEIAENAYKVEVDTFIWYNNAWMAVEYEAPFFFTYDEQTNVKIFYEYVNGDWVVATPYVSVIDEAETRNFYSINEAFRVASIKKDATIKLLRDLSNTTTACVFETQNTTCTLDLNGHTLAGDIANLVTVNAPGATFTITDNSNRKIGKISNAANKAVYVTKGTLVVANGTIESTGAYAIECASAGTIRINGGYLAAATKCVNVAGSCSISGGHFTDNTGLASYCAAHKYPFETDDSKYRYEVSDAWTITFKDGTTTLQTLHLKPGETPVYTAAQPTKDGYKFVGWNTSIVPATADATYTAQFEEVAAGSKCVTLNSNGGNEGLQYIYVTSGSAVGTLPQTTKEGNAFAGWFTDPSAGTQVSASTTVSADVTWYAHYTKNSYTLTWDANGGQLSGSHTSGTVQYGTAITAPTATLTGHTFIGWNITPAATMPAHDVTYTAQWSVAAKHYLQNIDGTYPETPVATDNVTGDINGYVTPATKTYSGFITPATQTVRIGETDEVRYEYARRTYTIALNANGGTCAKASSMVKHGATIALPNATRTGFAFAGWFTKAVGGDQITASTIIQRNIGTLYAHWSEDGNSVVAKNGEVITINAAYVEAHGNEIINLVIENGGEVDVTEAINVTNLYLESNGNDASGQLLGGTNVTATNAYFDFKANAKNHLWYAVAVPWQVDANTGISVNGHTLNLGSDFDIIYYDGARRATEGKNKCWQYVQNDGDQTLQPGRLYMIGLMMDAPTIRFTKKSDANISTTTTSVTAHGNGSTPITDKGWNGVANPSLFYAYLNPGTTEGQVYIPAEKRYEPIDMSAAKMVVGQGTFVQAPSTTDITVSYGGAYAAPRRARAEAVKADVRIAPAEADYTDRLFVKTTDSKESDVYTIGQDLAKVGVSSQVAQMWVDRYGEKLCVNTQAWSHATVTYPLGISVPTEGEYTITNDKSQITNDQYDLYLTLDGRVIWNLCASPYTAYMEAGTSYRYGLRMVANAPQTPTGMDEAIIDGDGETRKVLINNQIFIIRGENVYSVDGQLVK